MVHKCAQTALSGLDYLSNTLLSICTNRPGSSQMSLELSKTFAEMVLHMPSDFRVIYGLHRWPPQ